MPKTADRIILLVVGLATAALASLFWRNLQNDGFYVLTAIAIIVLWIKNRKLSKQLGEKDSDGGGA
jgi:hypothetical protein